MVFLTGFVQSGVNALLDYLSAHVITCLVPAFFIAGAIAAFISQGAILKYFGPKANKLLSYSVASVSGTVLAVCSCTVLPLFGGIYKRGAGLGPAIAFLYSGPAINVLAIVYSARLLGYDIGLARAVGSIVFSAGAGLLMAFLFRNVESPKNTQAFAVMSDEGGKSLWQQVVFLVALVAILIFAASKNWVLLGIFFALMLLILWRYYTRDDVLAWLRETAHFARLIFPWLLMGVFGAGLIKFLVPDTFVARYVGGNSLSANLAASLFGVLMYFATLTEVPIIKALIEMGMGKGPALALLLSGPALSLPSILALRSIMGWRKTLTYAAIVAVFATFTGYIFGFIVR
ncbi:MAG: permease [Chloroflexota bacterium]